MEYNVQKSFYSGRDMLTLSPFKDWLLRVISKLADWFGFWRFPVDLDIEGLNFHHALVWFHIAGNPVVRAEKGSGLEEHFARQREIGSPALPPGFQKQTTVSLSAVGDLMCNTALENSGERYYQNVADLIFSADVSFANLESTLTSNEIAQTKLSLDEMPKINATPRQYEIVTRYQGRKYSILQLANNHILDNGLDGILTTRQKLDEDSIPQVGTNLSAEEQQRGIIIESKGLKLGFVAATYSVNLRPFPEDRKYLVNLVPFHKFHADVDFSLLETQIAWCRAQGCDLVIASLHWGFEWEFYPRTYQLKQAHQLAEAGADIIIGQHAHVCQPMEWYQTKRDPDRWVPIFYGLGNLVPLVSAPFSTLSLVARLELVKGSSAGVQKTLVERASLTPVIQLIEDVDGKTIAWLNTLQSAQTSANTQRYADEAAKYANLVLGEGWRVDRQNGL